MRTYVIALAAVLTVPASSLISAAHAAAMDQSSFVPSAATGSCVFKKTEFSASIEDQSTTSTSFTDLGDGGSITFTQNKAGCVAGTFFGNAGNTTANDNVRLQVLLDGNECAPLTTGNYVFANSDVDLSSHAVAFFCGTDIAAGSHTVQVQWSAGTGGEAELFQHTLEVNHL
jgi:archaellum component FlaG (FlaF/FlaG flagellin family)